MFTEPVDIHIARSKRSNRGAVRDENRSGHPKVRGPEKTGLLGAGHPARTSSISASARDDMEARGSTWPYLSQQQEQHEADVVGCWAAQQSNPPPPHGSTIESDPLGLNNNVTEIAIGQSSHSPPRRALCAPPRKSSTSPTHTPLSL